MRTVKEEERREYLKRIHQRLLFIPKGDRIIRRVVFSYFVAKSKFTFVLTIFFLIALSELIFFLILFTILYWKGRKKGTIQGWPSTDKNIFEKIEFLYFHTPLSLVLLHYGTVWITFIFFVFFM